MLRKLLEGWMLIGVTILYTVIMGGVQLYRRLGGCQLGCGTRPIEPAAPYGNLILPNDGLDWPVRHDSSVIHGRILDRSSN